MKLSKEELEILLDCIRSKIEVLAKTEDSRYLEWRLPIYIELEEKTRRSLDKREEGID